jgi:hypothetical protein
VKNLDQIIAAVPTAHMREGVRMWLEHGVVGENSFLERLLANDLVGAFQHADMQNAAAMQKWAMWLYWDCPQICRGSEERVAQWRQTRGGGGK